MRYSLNKRRRGPVDVKDGMKKRQFRTIRMTNVKGKVPVTNDVSKNDVKRCSIPMKQRMTKIPPAARRFILFPLALNRIQILRN